MPSRTDWKHVRALSDAEIDRAIAEDPDTFEFTDEMLEQVRAVRAEPKDLVSLRLDRSILLFFKRRGPKYTSQINEVLRAYVDAQAKRPVTAGRGGRKPAAKK